MNRLKLSKLSESLRSFGISKFIISPHAELQSTMVRGTPVYLSSSPTAYHLSPSINISRLIYLVYHFRAQIRHLTV